MPFMMIMLAMLATIFLGADGRQDRRATEQASQAQATATRMAWYHSQAIKACPTAGACAVGEIPVDQAPLHASANLAANFQSATNGSVVVTTWRGTPPGTDARTMAGMVGAALTRVTDNSLNAGVYDKTASRIRSATSIAHAAGGATVVAQSQVVVPATIGTMPVQDGAPALVTPID